MVYSDFERYYKKLKRQRRKYRLYYVICLLTFKKEKSRRFKETFNSFNTNINLLKEHKNKCANCKIAVYTALYGNYDNIKPLNIKNSSCDFFIFTDQKIDSKSGYIVKKFNFDNAINDNVLKNRFLKMHPHLLFPNYEYSIYIDSSIVLNYDVSCLISRMDNKCIGMYRHFDLRDCIYDEGEIVKRINKAPAIIVDSQLKRYEEEGFPKRFGLFENTIIVREHNNKECIRIMESWWEEFIKKENTKRDQLCFMYVLWKNGLTKQNIASLGVGLQNDPLVSLNEHIKH